jgi:protoheme IX farnesyltransferase
MKDALNISDFADDEPEESASAGKSRWVDIYELTKPRLNFLVLATTMVGFYMAVRTSSDWLRLPATLIGTALCAAGASILNQVAERRYDKLMRRTADRPLPAGRVAPREAFLYGAVCGIVGVFCLAYFVNVLTATLGAITLLSYILIYTPMKRYTTLNTVIGAVPGGFPPIIGWTAVTGHLQQEALALFAILFIWQIPHFLSIAILYRDDYRAGGFRMLPVDDTSLAFTGRQIVLYASALIPVSLAPAVLQMAGRAYVVTAIVLGLGFLSFAMNCARSRNRGDARKLFFSSIIYLPLLMAALMLNRL